MSINTKFLDSLVIENNNKRLSLEEYSLLLAYIAALRSEDPFAKVGSCALRWDNSVAGMGYNGAPSGIEIDWSDRDERRKRVIHSEINCLRYCKPGDIKLLAATICPCSDCLKSIASYRINKVIYGREYKQDPFGLELAKEFGIEIIKLDISNLLKDFCGSMFSNSD